MTTHNDALAQLQQAGIPVEQIPEDQRDVLAGLSAEEIGVLIKIHQRLESDVQGYAFAVQQVRPGSLGGLGGSQPSLGGLQPGAAGLPGSIRAGGSNPIATDVVGGVFF